MDTGVKSSVSVIVCTQGRGEDLRSTLQSLQSVLLSDALSAELLVIENGIKGDAESAVNAFDHDRISARYIFMAETGKSRALNLALRQARGEILLFSDDDIRFPTNWIDQMCESVLSGRADAVAGGVRLAGHLHRPWMNRTHRAWLASTADYLAPSEPSELCGANMAFHRRVIDKVPSFETQLGPGVTGGGEESLFTWQLKQVGFRIDGRLDVEVEHHFNPSRLLYGCWLNTARSRGRTRAYLLHHWFHNQLRFPVLKSLYYRVKLQSRRALSPARALDEEGIPAWEMSYLTDLAMCEAYVRERKLPRAYDRQGLRKLWNEAEASTP